MTTTTAAAASPLTPELIESVINNLTIPAFFFEVLVEGGIEKNEVVDGQQRLTDGAFVYNGVPQ